eukprot:6491016-Amphidinium_carterae.3
MNTFKQHNCVFLRVFGAEEVAYYEIEDQPGEPNAFTLTCKKSIEFHASEENPKNVQGSAACFLPEDVWNPETNDVANILWATNWSTQGLTPAKPLVVLMCDMVIKPGMAVKVAGK